MPVVSDRKLTANRKNAKKSSGPKSKPGKRRSARNALSHGLAVPVGNVATLRSDIEALAMSIALASGERATTELSRQAAEAQLDILRIRKVRAAFLTRSFAKCPRLRSPMTN